MPNANKTIEKLTISVSTNDSEGDDEACDESNGSGSSRRTVAGKLKTAETRPQFVDGQQNEEFNKKAEEMKKSLIVGKRKRNTSSTRSEGTTSSDADPEDERIDSVLEAKLDQCAKRNNINSCEMRKILKALVGNPHVLALVRLRAEEEDAARHKVEHDIKIKMNAVDDQEKLNDDSQCTTKLTRSKAKALNKPLAAMVSLNEKPFEPEVAALITHDMHSDEDDEEYTPQAEDFVSDEDVNTTASDLDSQPRTPATPRTMHSEIEESPSKVQYTKDGIFKVPRFRNDSQVSQPEEIIAKRTRSKLCLETTAIETIESSFVPPDITLDMYEVDQELDPCYKEFLTDFLKPLDVNAEEDDDADPEYVAGDHEKVDREELRNVTIPQKEIDALFDELIEMFNEHETIGDGNQSSASIFEQQSSINQLLDVAQPVQKSGVNVKSPQRKKLKLFRESQQEEQVLMSTDLNIEQESQINYENQSNCNVTFNPNVMSTPTRQNACNLSNDNILKIGEAAQNITGKHQIPLHFIYYPIPTATTKTRNGPYHVTVTPGEIQNVTSSQTDSTVVPVQEITIKPASQSVSGQQSKKNSQKHMRQPQKIFGAEENPYSVCRKGRYFSIKNRIRQEYDEKYESLKSIPLNFTNENESLTDAQLLGFTVQQKDILAQQMRMHVQLATQNFLQTYAHPELWQHAPREKEMLEELEKLADGREDSVCNVWNLKPSLELCKTWEDQLSVSSSENTALMNFYNEEIEKAKSCKIQSQYLLKFPPRLLKLMIASPAFVYPFLLPHIPFRMSIPSRTRTFIPAEDQLIAFGLEQYRIEREELNRRWKVEKPHKVRLIDVCQYIATKYLVGKSADRIYKYMRKRENAGGYNPIKFYFQHQRAPPFKHDLYEVDFTNVLPPELRTADLPIVWSDFVNRLKTIEIERLENPFKFTSALNELLEQQGEKYTGPITHNSNNTGRKPSAETSLPAANFVIHLNYVVDSNGKNKNCNQATNALNCTWSLEKETSTEIATNKQSITNSPTAYTTKRERQISETDYSVVCTRIHDPDFEWNSNLDLKYDNCNETESLPVVNLPYRTFSTNSHDENNLTSSISIREVPKGQKLLTEFFKVQAKSTSNFRTDLEYYNFRKTKKLKKKLLRKFILKASNRRRHSISKRLNRAFNGIKQSKLIKKKFLRLLLAYRGNLLSQCEKFEDKNLRKIFSALKSLEIYTDLLINLRMITSVKKTKSTTVADDCPSKRAKCGDEETVKVKMSSRMNEFLKSMITTNEKPDEVDQKDSIYALNFYEKVEEEFKKCGKKEDFKKFQKILKNFDPQKDRVADLYHRIENLFLPDHVDLAEIFLTFLLPAEAAKVGKLFEHFMLTNMANFVAKLNVYFNKTPSQIRKIYACLEELSNQSDLTMAKIKSRILPMLKGNQFLIDWFLQMFPDERPPESLLTEYETVNLKESAGMNNEPSYEFVPCTSLFPDDPEDCACQIKYVNGRIFYGSKILLPAKLSFMADSLIANNEKMKNLPSERGAQFPSDGARNQNHCVHGIRTIAEQILKSHAEEKDKSISDEEREKRNSDEENKSSTEQNYQTCDEQTLRAHAQRLNPSLYGLSAELFASQQKGSSSTLSDGYSGKSSPKKQAARNLQQQHQQQQQTTKERRKSPKKNLPKSPISKNSTAVHETAANHQSQAIATTKKLKALIMEDDSSVTEEPSKPKRRHSKSFSADKSLTKSVVEPNDSNLDTSVEIKQAIWTRDEDKIILEEVKSGFESEAILIGKLSILLPHRTEAEILERHKFLMDVLTKLQNRG